VNSPTGKVLHLRGLNAKVIQAGIIHVGDAVKKLQPSLQNRSTAGKT